jgi:hypothetical protein
VVTAISSFLSSLQNRIGGMMKKAFCSAKEVVVFSEGMSKRRNLHLPSCEL